MYSKSMSQKNMQRCYNISELVSWFHIQLWGLGTGTCTVAQGQKAPFPLVKKGTSLTKMPNKAQPCTFCFSCFYSFFALGLVLGLFTEDVSCLTEYQKRKTLYMKRKEKKRNMGRVGWGAGAGWDGAWFRGLPTRLMALQALARLVMGHSQGIGVGSLMCPTRHILFSICE